LIVFEPDTLSLIRSKKIDSRCWTKLRIALGKLGEFYRATEYTTVCIGQSKGTSKAELTNPGYAIRTREQFTPRYPSDAELKQVLYGILKEGDRMNLKSVVTNVIKEFDFDPTLKVNRRRVNRYIANERRIGNLHIDSGWEHVWV